MTVQLATLGDGLRVASDAMPELETAALGVWVNAGARNESSAQGGVSHLLEHMAFKGTGRRSARAIAEEVEAVGGQINAYTSREQTAYFIRVLKEDVELALDILADILQHSTFEAAELEREREVVIQEIGQVQDTPDDLIFDLLQETAFPDQPMGRSILGSIERVRAFERQALVGYMERHYQAPQMVLAASGRIDHEALVERVGELFRLPAGAAEARQPARYQGGERREERQLEQAHLALAFPGLAFDDEDFYAIQVLSTVLGGGMSSRLFQELREKRGLCYSVFSFASAYLDAGLFGVYAGTGEGELGELVPVLCDEIARVAEDVDESETARARAQHKAGIMMGLEAPMARCEHLGRQLLIYDRAIPTAELIAEIDAVDATALKRVAGRVLAGGPPALAAIGPISRLESYDAVRARFS
ncbi:MAG: pitrilysin family protein [Alphaproteobacteria bacterium]|nr:peptidase M16 [Rhodospirillaceae bacterium]MDP6403637.1 pitrilysin family protein [Alphaproteobacteria bacterium]MDP6623225.1 pitrilysin family protein [Alphaproteobacteria bacterium]